ncbi:restriction endonuclease, partial [Blautia producta]
MDFILEYDETDPISIEEYGKKLVGKTFAEVCEDDDITKAMVVREINNYEAKHENK